jgi:hypothetical protein
MDLVLKINRGRGAALCAQEQADETAQNQDVTRRIGIS